MAELINEHGWDMTILHITEDKAKEYQKRLSELGCKVEFRPKYSHLSLMEDILNRADIIRTEKKRIGYVFSRMK